MIRSIIDNTHEAFSIRDMGYISKHKHEDRHSEIIHDGQRFILMAYNCPICGCGLSSEAEVSIGESGEWRKLKDL